MKMLHLSCEWLVKFDQVPKLKDLNDLVKSLNGEFRILPSFYFSVPVIDLLLVKLNESELLRFLEQVESIGFTGWRDIPASLFEDKLAFNPYRKSSFTQRTWEARLRLAHYDNRSVNEMPVGQIHLGRRPTFLDLSVYPATKALFDLFDSERGPDAALAIRNFGDKPVDEILKMLKEKGFLPNDEGK